jgi:hypothetical protein
MSTLGRVDSLQWWRAGMKGETLKEDSGA